MPLMEVDLENVIKPTIEAGVYLAEITSAEMKTAEKSGSLMIAWEFTICEPGDEFGKTLTHYSYLASNQDEAKRRKANWYLREFLDKIKCAYNPGSFETESALHCKAKLKVKMDKYEGRDTNKIEEIYPEEWQG